MLLGSSFLSSPRKRRKDEPKSACGGGYVRSNQTQIKITGLPPEKRGQVIKSFLSEKNAFAVTGENKNIICETGKGTQSARTRKCQFCYPILYFKSWNRFRSYIPSVFCTPPGGGGDTKNLCFRNAPFTNPCFINQHLSHIHLLQINLLQITFYKSMFYKSAPFTNPPFTNPSFTNLPFTNPPFTNPCFTNPPFTNPCFTNPVHVLPIQSNPVHSIFYNIPSAKLTGSIINRPAISHKLSNNGIRIIS